MKHTLSALFLVLLFTASCKKETTSKSIPATPVTNVGQYSTLGNLLYSLRLQAKTVSIDASTGGSFYGNSGTRYFFRPGCFRDANGKTVTGMVDIAVTEYLKKGDMIFSGALTMSDSRPLISFGEVNIIATQGSAEIFLKTGMPVFVTIPQSTKVATNTQLFFGIESPIDTMDRINWKVLDTNTQGNVKVIGDSLQLWSDSLHWLNGDCFLETPNYQSFTVTISIDSNLKGISKQILCFALVDGKLNAWPIKKLTDPVKGVFSETYVPDMPVHLVACTIINGHFYAGITAATPTTGSNYIIKLSEADPAAFKASLNNL